MGYSTHELKRENLGLSNAHNFIPSICSSCHISVILTWTLAWEPTLPLVARLAVTWCGYREQLFIAVIILIIQSTGHFRALQSTPVTRILFGWSTSSASSTFGWFFRSALRRSHFDLGARLRSDHATPTPRLFATKDAVTCILFRPQISLASGCTFGLGTHFLPRIKSRLRIVAVWVRARWCPAECTIKKMPPFDPWVLYLQW